MLVRNNDHNIHICASDYKEKSVHVLLVYSLPLRGNVRTNVVARTGQNNRTSKILEIFHRSRNHIYFRQGSELKNKVHGLGYIRNRIITV